MIMIKYQVRVLSELWLEWSMGRFG